VVFLNLLVFSINSSVYMSFLHHCSCATLSTAWFGHPYKFINYIMIYYVHFPVVIRSLASKLLYAGQNKPTENLQSRIHSQ